MLKNVVLLAVVTVSLYGARVPNIGNILNEMQTPNFDKEKEMLPPLKKEDEEYKKIFKDTKKVFVKGFLIDGNTQIHKGELKKILKPYEEKKVSFNDMQKIANLISLKYKEKGYIVARAYIPIQNLKAQNDILKISIIEGEFGKFKLKNSSFVKDSILQKNLDEVKNSKVIFSKTLERGLLLINDTPGVNIKSTQILAGHKIGTSDFTIETQASDKYNGYVIADNYGSHYTGKHRLIGGLDINSPFKIGDKINISVLSSEDAELLNGRVSYQFPLNNNGLIAELSYSKTTYELGSTYKDLNALGDSSSIVAKITYPYIRSNYENLNTYLITSYNKMNDEIQDTNTHLEKSTLVATFGIDYTKIGTIFNQYTKNFMNISLSMGNLKFYNESDKDSDKLGANTNGNFSKINIDLENTIFLSSKLQWRNNLKLQYALANKNLDGSEDMSIGGVYGVKFYHSGEESAENGYIFSTELLYALPKSENLNSQVGIFYDNGRVYMSDDFTGDKSRTLQGIGLSYNLFYKEFFLKSHLSYKVGGAKVTSEDTYNSRFMLQTGWVF